MRRAILAIASDYGWIMGDISVALVGDAEIRKINQRHLAHDYSTDVISFDLTDTDEVLEGEIIASVETADREASEHKWSGDDELLLYIIHGMLHIIGLGRQIAGSHYVSMVRGIHRRYAFVYWPDTLLFLPGSAAE